MQFFSPKCHLALLVLVYNISLYSITLFGLIFFQTFDRFHCGQLVMDCLCAFDDSSMNRMSVAICGILAAKVRKSYNYLNTYEGPLQKFQDINMVRIGRGY